MTRPQKTTKEGKRKEKMKILRSQANFSFLMLVCKDFVSHCKGNVIFENAH